MELFVILAMSQAPDSGGWQTALAAHHIPVHFSQSLDFAQHSGFIPLTVEGRESGFYFLRGDYSELAQHDPAFASINVEHPIVYSLGYGGHGLEGAAAFYSAAALVAEFHGIAFEPQGRVFMSEQQLIETAKLCLILAEFESQLNR